jgi:hypothetical protein
MMTERKAPQYLCFGYEEAPTTGTPHLQGFIYFKYPRFGRCVKNLLPNKPYVAAQKGSNSQAIAYCMKESRFGAPEEFGERPMDSGKQKVMERLLEAYDRRGLYHAAKEEREGFMRYGGALERYHRLMTRVTEKFVEKKVVWIYGPSGSGKTWLAFDMCKLALGDDPKGIWKWDAKDLGFLNGYVDQEVALIDDYKYTPSDSQQLLNILDKYSHLVPVKGGSQIWKVKFIVITCLFKPADCFFEFHGPTVQVERRISEIIEMNGDKDHSYHFVKGASVDPEFEVHRQRMLNEMMMDQSEVEL